ncbi:hypothetical protein SGPA1_40854 [Streptomyces misionensis JCM 4497]
MRRVRGAVVRPAPRTRPQEIHDDSDTACGPALATGRYGALPRVLAQMRPDPRPRPVGHRHGPGRRTGRAGAPPRPGRRPRTPARHRGVVPPPPAVPGAPGGAAGGRSAHG